MRIETDLKLGFKDVMIRPKRGASKLKVPNKRTTFIGVTEQDNTVFGIL
jgi:hypothetical protein